MNDGLKTFVQTIAVVLLLAVAGCVWKWTWIVQWRVEGDLRDYARATRRADLPLHDKEEVLNCIQHLEDQLAEGEVVGYFRWRYSDEIVRDLIRGRVDHDKATLILRELHRVETKMNE